MVLDLDGASQRGIWRKQSCFGGKGRGSLRLYEDEGAERQPSLWPGELSLFFCILVPEMTLERSKIVNANGFLVASAVGVGAFIWFSWK